MQSLSYFRIISKAAFGDGCSLLKLQFSLMLLLFCVSDVLDGLMTPESPVGGTELNSAANLLAQGAGEGVCCFEKGDICGSSCTAASL